MRSPVIRVYADTSVYGGFFDEEFSVITQTFFNRVRSGEIGLVISDIVREEIDDAPQRVRSLFDELAEISEVIDVGDKALSLRDAYIEAGIVSRRWLADALHVAAATILQCNAIVSWNFHHIVHLKKIPLYNAVSRAKGFRQIAILSPSEIVHAKDQGF